MRTMKAGVALLFVALSVACGSEGGSKDDGTTEPETMSAPSEGTTSTGDSFGEKGPASADGCSEAAKDIYVLSNNFDLYRFNPGKLTFTRVGQFDCIGPKNPNFFNAGANYFFRGMAIDRTGHGWLSMMRSVDSLAAALLQPTATAVDQALVEFNATDATCKVHEYEPVMTMTEFSECGLVWLGTAGLVSTKCQEINARVVGNLTYASQSASSQESLYGTKDFALVSIDPAANQRSPIGVMSETKKSFGGGLTGTGDGQLFDLSAVRKEDKRREYTFTVGKRDRATAGLLESAVVDFDSVKLWPSAMTFWGGDLWFFGIPRTDDGGAEKQAVSVVQYKTETKTLTTVIQSVGDAIGPAANSDWSVLLGAANSTCAPLSAPK